MEFPHNATVWFGAIVKSNLISCPVVEMHGPFVEMHEAPSPCDSSDLGNTGRDDWLFVDADDKSDPKAGTEVAGERESMIALLHSKRVRKLHGIDETARSQRYLR